MELKQFLSSFFLLCSISLPSSRLTAAVSSGNETDYLALLEFKNQLTDPSGAVSSWNDSIHFCEWEGVSCGSTKHLQRVTALDLSYRDVTGVMSPFIANLTFLTEINLSNNGFSGAIPAEIGHLHRLRTLNLSRNSFQGQLPTNLSYCSNLERLDLRNNQFIGTIPSFLISLSKLHSLLLDVNNMTGGIPPFLGNFSSLTQLSLTANPLGGSIPKELSSLAKLTFLQIPGNFLSGTIPPSLFNISTLNVFNVAANKLHGRLPPDLGIALPKLTYLIFGGNQFEGPIPASLSNCSELGLIDLPNNRFSGRVPPSLGRLQKLYSLNLGNNSLKASNPSEWEFLDSLSNCSHLQTLDLHTNLLSGVLPDSVANLTTQLQFLALGYNKLSGSIPPGIENLVGLNHFGMVQNRLTGTIPPGIGNLKVLQNLFLYDNLLTGNIPSSLGNSTQLSELLVYSNNLEGPIPPSLGSLQHLTTLDLSNNHLTGTIPKEVVNLPYISIYMDLSHNLLVGPLPPEVGNMKNLRSLHLSGNKLSGDIPNTLGNCEVLQVLLMSDNLFQGIIPPSLGNIKGLQQLDLSHNNLSGSIPELLESISVLEYLNLSFNQLEGEVPTKGVFKDANAVSLAGNEGLCGGIPELHLAACPIKAKASEKRTRSRLVTIVIPVASVVFCVLVIFSIVFIYLKLKARRKTLSKPSPDDQYHRASYTDLVRATNGFSSTNIIGTGRYGSVYKGTLDQGSTFVAVKVFHLHESGASKSFMAECEALRSIRHRNLVKIITSCSSIDSEGKDFKALVFELMPNGSLEAWLHPGVSDDPQMNSLSLFQRLNIAIDVANALVYLHHDCQPSIVHCDLKPGNVLLDKDMTAHVGDFGLAKLLSEASSNSLQDSVSSVGIRGSIGYVAPEYGLGGQVSTLGDVYSYGILLLEMFTGRRPVDDAFMDGLTLRNSLEKAFPKNIMQIIDQSILLEDEVNLEEGNKIREIHDFLEYVLRVGLLCSKQIPGERMNMRNVAVELQAIRDVYVDIHTQRE